jgi:hypothetical protein
MKSPKKAPLMKACFEQAFETVNADNTDWLKPVVILNDHIARLGLSKYVKHNISNPDLSEVVDLYRYFAVGVPKRYHIIHWMNEQYRGQGVDNNCTIKGSLLDMQMVKHGIPTNQLTLSNTPAGRIYNPA